MNYWEFLRIQGAMNQNERNEIEEGILLIIYLLYTEIFEGEVWSNLFRNELFDIVNSFVSSFKPDNERKRKIVDCIKFSIDNYKNEKIRQQY